jgi:pyrimidine operon attenuation protein/uracil phosphoribosyltransferase
MTETRTLVLDHVRILQKLRRIAYQIYEANAQEKDLVIVAVEEKGTLLAGRILPILRDVAPFEIVVINLKIDKKNPLNAPMWMGDEKVLEGKAVVLIDDVLNSGRTLMYAARDILDHKVKKLNTVVLVDRLHRKFPIKADFVGLTLSTTLQDHINVVFDDGNDAVYLE